jgi:hypothetical protein
MSLYDPATSTVIRSYRADDKTPGKLSHSIVYSMYQDEDGKGPLWLGTSNGLNRLDTPDSPFQAIHFGNTASDYINAIAPGAGGVLWLATGNSLIRYEIKTDARKIYYNDPQDPHHAQRQRHLGRTGRPPGPRVGRLGMEWRRPRPAGSGQRQVPPLPPFGQGHQQPERRQHRQPA